MDCPYCGGASRVVDSRPTSDGTRRRRHCNECKRRFTTYERLGPTDIKVIKRGDRPTEPFEHDKLVQVMVRVCAARPLTREDLVRLARDIEGELVRDRRQTIHSWELANMVLVRLQQVDAAAYARFAADYLDLDGRLRTRPVVGAAGDPGQLGLFGGEDDPISDD